MRHEINDLMKNSSNVKNQRFFDARARNEQVQLGIVGQKFELSDKVMGKKRFKSIIDIKSGFSFTSQKSESKEYPKNNNLFQSKTITSIKSRGSIRLTSFNTEFIKALPSFESLIQRKKSFRLVKRYIKDSNHLQDWTVEESYTLVTPISRSKTLSLKDKNSIVNKLIK